MQLPFQLAYLFGYAPWDRWQGKPLRRLRELFEGPQALHPGRVLDLGCGMGRATIYLAQLGWKATGIDAVERALRVARRRAWAGVCRHSLLRLQAAFRSHFDA
jgi:SAM-dependent methyltransferase